MHPKKIRVDSTVWSVSCLLWISAQTQSMHPLPVWEETCKKQHALSSSYSHFGPLGIINFNSKRTLSILIVLLIYYTILICENKEEREKKIWTKWAIW